MTDKAGYDRRRQRTVLTKLRRNAGLEIDDVAKAADLSYPQTVRYLDGRTPLHSFRIASFARALGVNPLDLAAELNGQDVIEDHLTNPGQPLWSFRDALKGILTEEHIERLAPHFDDRSLIDQRAAVEGMKLLLEQRISETTLKPHRRRTAAC